ncbi:hypothetical protein SAMN05216337_1017152 [Bradyrhizobium brasilense]|uniref:Large polyvalent protein associated domain-containing protein n=1 Tax=Bradyrhizobium brasilense TaxID=1419277 RepID=A0A1G6YYX6_9BRAD|nr:hypothetical protein [Bradyrhizobium brasilense]SDD95704.1 hypothetical protein SAMN05216337_1017152 [Bradyrhizobium brasilense]
MAGRKDCIDEILEAIGKRMKRSEVEDHLEDIDSRAESYQSEGMARAEALRRATEDVLKENSIRGNIAKRNAREDAVKLRDLRNYVDGAKKNGHSAELAIEARLTGTNVPIFDAKSRAGNQLSVAALALGAKKDWIGGVVTDLERIGRDEPKFRGLDSVFYSRKIEDDIFREKWQLDHGDRGKPGITKNEAALKIAEVLHKWDRVRINALNSEGAWITDYAGHVTKMVHDPDRIRRAASPFDPRKPRGYFYKGFTEADRAAWVSKTLQHIDVKRTFGGADAEQALAHMYGGFIDGSHMEPTLEVTGEPGVPNIAGHVSQKRTLHWKSADDWLAYNKAFGRLEPTDQWLKGLESGANHYALMKVFGSKPRENFADIVKYGQDSQMGTPQRLSFDKRVPALENRYRVISGEADRPIANMWSGIVNGVMAVQRWSKLGFTPFAMLQDNVTISRELANHGLGLTERWSSMLSGYFQGAEGSAKAEVADLLHTGILGRLRGVTARFDISDARAGTMAKVENHFFKWTGMTAMTENKRADAERMMAYAMGKNRGKAFAELGADEGRMLEAFGIGDKEWSLLNTAEWNTIEGQTYLTPDVAQRLSNDDVDAYLKSRGSISDQATSSVMLRMAGHIPTEAADRARQDLALKLWAYYSERGQYAVLEPGAREKAILYQGTQQGSPLNVALRLLLQFKQFPATMITKSWGTEIYGGRTGLGRIAGLTELIVGSTIFGVLANFLNQTAKGQDPTTQWKNQPVQALISGFLRGGAASIYGDFLLGEWSRFGMSAADTLLGPTAGQFNALAELWTDATHMKKGAATGALAVRMVRSNTPYLNTIYLRTAFDYMVTYRLQEWLNPGYLERMERTMKDKQGIEFWLRPTQVSR